MAKRAGNEKSSELNTSMFESVKSFLIRGLDFRSANKRREGAEQYPLDASNRNDINDDEKKKQCTTVHMIMSM